MIENSNLKELKLFPFQEWENEGREKLNNFQSISGRIRFVFYMGIVINTSLQEVVQVFCSHQDNLKRGKEGQGKEGWREVKNGL